MSFQTPPAKEGDQFVESIITSILEEMKDVNIDDHEVDEGDFTNVRMKLDFPKENAVTFRADPDTDTMLFKLHGVNAKIDTDMNLFYGSIKGHGTFTIENMDIDLKTIPKIVNGQETVHVLYHVHMKDADIFANFDALEDTDHLPEEFAQGFAPLMENLDFNYKIAATQIVDDGLKKQGEEVLNNYLKKMSSNYRINKKLDHQVGLLMYHFI